MKNFFSILTLLTLIFAASCGKSEPQDTAAADGSMAAAEEAVTATGDIDYDGMAEDLCVCLRPMFDFQNELIQLLGEGDEEKIMAMSDRATKIQIEGEACVGAIEAKYGIIEGPEKEALATEALRKACPDIVDMMEGAGDPSMMEEIPAQ